MDHKSLDIINREIHRLSEKTSLDINDIKSLELLVKTRALLLGEPTDITKELSEDVSEEQILSALKPKLVK